MAGTTNMPDMRTRLTLDIADFTRGLVSARAQASLFGSSVQTVTSNFAAAGIAMATFATLSLFTAGIVATAFMGSIAVLMTLGAVGASQAQSVKDAWTNTANVIQHGILQASRSYVPVLERLAGKTSAVFTQVQPALTQVFDRLAPLFEDISTEFLDWLGDLVNRMPTMVNAAIGFLFEIGPAWDEATDNMRAGWDRVYQAVLSFGPALLQNGLPPFGAFVGNVLALLAPVIEAASIFSGTFFSALNEVALAAGGLLSGVLVQITPGLDSVAVSLGGIGTGLGIMLSGIGGPLSMMLDDLSQLGAILSVTFAGLEPTLTGLLQSAAETGQALLPVISFLAGLAVQVGPVVVALSQMVSSMIQSFVTGLSPILGQLSPDWANNLVMGIEAITPAMSQAAEIAGRFVAFLVQGAGMIIAALGSVADFVGGLTGIFHNTGFSAGTALVVGIIAGLGFMVSPLTGVVAGLVAAVAAFLPRSPAETGPLSGDGSPDQRGIKLGQMFADGIASTTDLVKSAAQKLVTGVPGMTSEGSSAGGIAAVPVYSDGGGGAQTIIVNVQGSVITDRDLQDVIQTAALRRENRNGGSVLATSVRSS